MGQKLRNVTYDYYILNKAKVVKSLCKKANFRILL